MAMEEPEGHTFEETNNDFDYADFSNQDAKKDLKFVNEQGQSEDREAARAIFETVTAKANSHLTFGYFEKAIVNFHQHLTKML